MSICIPTSSKLIPNNINICIPHSLEETYPLHKGVRGGYPPHKGVRGGYPPHKGVREGYPPPYTSLWDLNFSISAEPILSGT